MTDEGQPKRKRAMISLACENCRASHLKCDGNIQCNQCRKRKITCTYSKPKRRGRKPIMKDPRNDEPISTEKPVLDPFANPAVSPQPLQRPLSTGKIDFSSIPPNSNFTVPNASEMPPNEIDNNLAFIPGSNQLANLNLALASPYNQFNLCQTLSTYLNVYLKYLHFVHPYFKIPRDGAMALSLISVPFDLQSHKERIYNMALNTILALGASLLRNNQHADEFAQCATIIAKDFLFETTDYQIASGFVLLSYYYYLQMETEKAIVLNNLASSICKNLKVLDTSPVGLGTLLAKVIMYSNNYVKQNQLFARLVHQTVDLNKMIFALILQTHTRIRNEVNPDFKSILVNLEAAEKTLSTFKNAEKDFELVVYKSFFLFTKAIIYWKAKIFESALQYATEGLKVMHTLSADMKYFPVMAVDIFDDIISLFVDTDSIEIAEQVLQILASLPWFHHVRSVLERLNKKCTEQSVNVNFLRSVKVALSELEQRLGPPPPTNVPPDKSNAYSMPSPSEGYVPLPGSNANDAKQVQSNVAAIDMANNNVTNSSSVSYNAPKSDGVIANNGNTARGDVGVGLTSIKPELQSELQSESRHRLSIDVLNNNPSDEMPPNFRKSFHSFSNEMSTFLLDPNFANSLKSRTAPLFSDQWPTSTPTPPSSVALPTSSLNFTSSSATPTMGTKDPNRDSLPPVTLPPLSVTPLPPSFNRSSTPSFDPLLMRDTLTGTPTPAVDFATYDFLNPSLMHRSSTPNVVGGTAKSNGIEEQPLTNK